MRVVNGIIAGVFWLMFCLLPVWAVVLGLFVTGRLP